MSELKRFMVVGAGAWGTALAQVLAVNGHQVSLYTHEGTHREALIADRENKQYLPGTIFNNNIAMSEQLEDDVSSADFVLIAVPSHAFAQVLERIAPHLNDNGLVWATKGLDPKTGEFLHVVAKDILGDAKPMAVITGPSFAKEVGDGQPTAIVIAGNDHAFVKNMQGYFQAPHFRTYLCDDFLGAQIGGALKNVMAIAVGIADGLGFGANARAALITRALAEMIRLAEKLGAKTQTLTGLSGLGDLILTCSDNLSRNRRFGLYVGQGMSFDEATAKVEQVVEGFGNTQLVYDLAKKNDIDMPIVYIMYHVLYEGLPAREAVDKLLSREAQGEWR